MIDRVVCIGGPSGSGKTTVGRKVAEIQGLEFVSAGELFRAEATERGMDLMAFSLYAVNHEEVDRTLDDRMLASAGPGRLLEGRVSGALCRRRGILSANLAVTALASVRFARLARRDGVSLDAARQAAEERERLEAKRYRAIYGIDLTTETADFVVDSTDRSPAAVTDRLLDYLRSLSRS